MFDKLIHGISLAGLIASAIVVGVAFLIDRLFVFALDRELKRHKAQDHDTYDSYLTRTSVLRRLGRIAIYTAAISAALSHFPLLHSLSTGLWASAGVAGLVIGMAAKGTLGNAIAGVTLAFSQPFRIGDGVTIRDDYGIVEEITLMYTMIRTRNNRLLMIPNDVLSTEVFHNHSLLDPRILTTALFFVAYGIDLDQAMSVLLQAATASPERLPKSEVKVLVGEIQGGAIRLDVWVWAADQTTAWVLQSDVRLRGLAALATLKALPRQLPAA